MPSITARYACIDLSECMLMTDFADMVPPYRRWPLYGKSVYNCSI
jgi:hypothetical protein